MDVILHPAVVAAISVAIGAIAAAFTARWKSEPDVQSVTNAAVAGIIQHYTQALADQTREVHDLREEIKDMRATVEAQNVEIAQLNDHIIDLCDALARRGVTPPTRRHLAGTN
jgi:septal ring factor EnvC (AmiA/AmiB activator)